MNKQSKKVKLCDTEHAALKNNRVYLLRTEITKSHLNNHICQHCGMRTSSVTPFFITFLISACPATTACQVSSEIYGAFFYWGNRLNPLAITKLFIAWPSESRRALHAKYLPTIRKSREAFLISKGKTLEPLIYLILCPF